MTFLPIAGQSAFKEQSDPGCFLFFLVLCTRTSLGHQQDGAVSCFVLLRLCYMQLGQVLRLDPNLRTMSSIKCAKHTHISFNYLCGKIIRIVCMRKCRLIHVHSSLSAEPTNLILTNYRECWAFKNGRCACKLKEPGPNWECKKNAVPIRFPLIFDTNEHLASALAPWSGNSCPLELMAFGKTCKQRTRKYKGMCFPEGMHIHTYNNV